MAGSAAMKPLFTPKRLVALVIALLLAAIAGAVYSAFVSPVVPVRIEVVRDEQTAQRHLVTLPIPDLSNVRGQITVLGMEIRNNDSEPKRIGLLREGFQRYRVVVPPGKTIRWDIVLSPELVEGLDRETGDARSLELTADADVWSLMAFEIRNYHVRWGDRVSVSVLPTTAGGYRVQFSPFALFLLSAALFVPVVSYLFDAQSLLARTRSLAAIVVRGWKRHEVTFERGAAVLGLAAIAIAQPIFEVVSNSPEFFPARSTPPATAIATVLVICFGVPLALLGIERAIRLASARAAATFHGIVVALLIAALVMPGFRRSEVLVFPWDVVISAVIALAVALAYSRIRTVRQFLTALAPAALVVPILFLLDPSVQQSFSSSESAAAVETIERTPPIVLVIFDELPLNSLLNGGGNIDAERYPNFGALAREAYWFRNASTVTYNTSDAVPAILSGRYVKTDKAVPTLRYHPVNLFTALARHYNIFASLRFQQLCPPRACQQNSAIPGDTVESLLSDLGLVWLHIVLPQELTEELPPVVGEWAEFGRTRETPAARVRGGRGAIFAQFVSSIDDQPARLHVLHLVLPHMAFEYVPTGRRYRGPDYQTRMYRGKALFEGVSPAYADTLHQRHLAQVGFVDRLVGDLIGRLRETGAYDKALVIITADHGASYLEGRSRRQPRPQQHNLSDILQVPLFMKLPGQQRGEVVDRIVETVDIFPTILDVLGVKAALRLDGRSLIDSDVPERSPRTFYLRSRFNAPPRALGDLSADRAASLERKERRFGSGDDMAMYAPPGARHLLGMNVNRTGMHPAPDVRITIHNPSQFEAVKRDRDPLPIYVRGDLDTSRSDPLNVAVIVNGIVAAVAQSYREQHGHVFGTLIPETALRDGDNTVAAFVVDGLHTKE
jgi:hypothetical protein